MDWINSINWEKSRIRMVGDLYGINWEKRSDLMMRITLQTNHCSIHNILTTPISQKTFQM